ncbi:MAG: SDR family oxidoreductase [bacterium]
MRVLVTGNLGYVGSVLTPMLAERGHEVFGYDTGYFRDCLLYHPVEEHLAAQHFGDIRELNAGLLDGVDAIVHLAALSNDPLGELDPLLTHRINTEATQRLATLAKEQNVRRFVFASSCSIYGASAETSLTESSPMNPLTAYARSKVDVERILNEMADDDFSPTSLRNATAYGLSPRLRLDMAVNNLTGWGFATGKVTLLSDGSAWRPMVHVEDMGLAVCETLEAPRERVHGQAMNVGDETENYQIRTVAEIISESLEGTEVTFAEGAAADSRTYNVSFAKIRSVLPNFRPRWTVRRGVAQLLDAFQENVLTDEMFRGRLFTRLKQLRYLMEEKRIDRDLRWTSGDSEVHT